MTSDLPLEIEIDPEPDGSAGAALVQAVQAVAREAALGEPAAATSAWRRQALRDLVDDGMPR